MDFLKQNSIMVREFQEIREHKILEITGFQK